MDNFSNRMGLAPIVLIQKDSINEALRNGAWTIVYDFLRMDIERQPEFRPSHNAAFIKYIEDYKIPPLMEIAKQSYVISKEISILEKTLSLSPKNIGSLALSNLYYEGIIKEVIKKITLNVHLYYANKRTKQEQFDPTQTELYKFLYPSSFAEPDQYECDDKTGLNIIKDDFYEIIITKFKNVLSELDKLLIK